MVLQYTCICSKRASRIHQNVQYLGDKTDQVAVFLQETTPDDQNGVTQYRDKVTSWTGAHPACYPLGTGALSRGVRRPGRDADHSPPSSAKIKNAWNCTSTPNTSSWRGA